MSDSTRKIANKSSSKNPFWDYQIDANRGISMYLENGYDECIVKMFCGSGKSLVMCNATIIKNNKLIVYVFPSLVLVDQFATDYLNYDKKDFANNPAINNKHILKVSSEDKSATDEYAINHFFNQNPNEQKISIKCACLCVCKYK